MKMKSKFSIRAVWHSFVVVVCAGAAMLISSSAQAQNLFVADNYDLVSDFSNSQNPNGPWSFTYNDALIPQGSFVWGGTGWGAYYYGDGSVQNGIPYGAPVFDWQPGDVLVHALSYYFGGASTFVKLNWTAPEAGTVDITGRVWDAAIDPNRDDGWTLAIKGSAVAGRNSILGISRTDSTAQFGGNLYEPHSLSNISVNAGDTISLAVFASQDWGHFAGVDMDIQYVPEPSTCAAFLGLLSVGLAYRRWRG
jgi:hypothetical protein